MQRLGSLFISIAVFIFLAGAAFALGRQFQSQSMNFHTAHGYILPDPRVVKIFCLGFDNLASDFFAISAVNSLRVKDVRDPEYWKESVRFFKKVLKNPKYHSHRGTVDLASFARYAYISSYLDPYDTERIELFTLLMTWVFNFPDGSIPILEYTSQKNLLDWKPPYYLALNYLIFKADKQKALYWLREASLRPQELPVIKSLLVDLAAEGNNRENILNTLSGLKEIVRDEEIKKNISQHIQTIENGGVVRSVDWARLRSDMEKTEFYKGTDEHEHEHEHEHKH